MGMIYMGLFFFSVAAGLIFSSSQPGGAFGLAIVGLVVFIFGVGVLLTGLKKYFIQEILDALKKLSQPAEKKEG